MIPKVIGGYLVLSYMFLWAFGMLTESQFAAFKGYDPTKLCKHPAKLKEFCNKIGAPTIGKNEPFKPGYPSCSKTPIKLKKDCGSETVTKWVRVIDVGWEKHYWYTFGKGQETGNVMFYNCSPDGDCHPEQDMLYNENS